MRWSSTVPTRRSGLAVSVVTPCPAGVAGGVFLRHNTFKIGGRSWILLGDGYAPSDHTLLSANAFIGGISQ